MTRARAGVCHRCSRWRMVTEGMCAPCRRIVQLCVGQLELVLPGPVPSTETYAHRGPVRTA